MTKFPDIRFTAYRSTRRSFLGGLAAAGLSVPCGLRWGAQLAGSPLRQDVPVAGRQLLLITMRGGLSQLESWDPKPRSPTGGPFRAIPTSVPGLHISELLPQTAGQMHRLGLIRSLQTREAQHQRAEHLMLTGDPIASGSEAPSLAAVLGPSDAPSLLEVEHVTPRDRRRYGDSAFARQCLSARHQLEQPCSWVHLSHWNYDTHIQNFRFHRKLLGEFDRPFASLIDDLALRGVLDQTLVVVLSEFGRTPHINRWQGRDHWTSGWSAVVGGAGIQPGAVVGRTNRLGTEVVDHPVSRQQLQATILRALEVDSSANVANAGQTVRTVGASGAIDAMLA